jgi:serine/threonine-protein kinase
VLAEETASGRKVAIKIIAAGCEGAGETACLPKHPNVRSVYEIAEDEGGKFVVMEYIDGLTLGQLLKVKVLPLKQVIDIAAQIAAGMAAVQEQGIVHCDLKPGNIMIDRGGRAKLLDFGLAETPAGPVQEKENERRGREQVGEKIVWGTAAYMSPERIKGMKPDGRSDVFSFGVVLYEMIENRQPFGDDEENVTLHNILHRQARFNRPAPPALRAIVRRCLHKDRARRFQNFFEIREALAALRPAGQSQSGMAKRLTR